MKNKNLLKKSLYAAACMAMALSPLQTYAKTCSITITNKGEQSLIGKKIELFKLFNVETSEDGVSHLYSINPEYKTYIEQAVKQIKNMESITEDEIIAYLEDVTPQEHEAFSKTLSEIFDKNKIKGIQHEINEVGPSGEYTLQGIDYGYYLMRDITNQKGQYGAKSIFVNFLTNSENIYLKSDYPSEVTKKVFEDDNGTSWNDIGDFEIDQPILFQHTASIPKLQNYKTYYFSLHDEMNPALTLDSEKIQVEIIGKIERKKYTLTKEEYQLVQSGNNFEIRIPDLKALIESKYPDGECGTLVVTYVAKLNETARNDTGNPGYENKVRLEYSNDPYSESTGFTPWDTVVCYTYKVDVTKQNSDGTHLKDAHFKLYSDPQCQQEVYCFKTNEGYVRTQTASKATELVSDENGNFNIIGLDQGTYYLKETKAPAGYKQLVKPIQIDIIPSYQSDRQNYISGQNALLNLEMKANKENLETNLEQGSAKLTVVNQIQHDLPFTGSSNIVLFTLTGASLMVIACLKRKKQ